MVLCGIVLWGKVANDLPGRKLGQILCTYLHYGFPKKQLRSKNREFDINLLAAAFFFFFLTICYFQFRFFYLLVLMPMSFLNDRLFLSRMVFRRALSLPNAKNDVSVSLRCVSLYFCPSIGLPSPPLFSFFRATRASRALRRDGEGKGLIM